MSMNAPGEVDRPFRTSTLPSNTCRNSDQTDLSRNRLESRPKCEPSDSAMLVRSMHLIMDSFAASRFVHTYGHVHFASAISPKRVWRCLEKPSHSTSLKRS
jgi:hypothetical protein